MTAVANPYPIFLDLSGTGLSGGSVYIGVANQDPQTNPQAAYWDAALTTPASQPLQVTDGYIYRSGSPATPYTSGSYSIKVLDAHGAQVFYAPVVAASPIGFLASINSALDVTIAANAPLIFPQTGASGYNPGSYYNTTTGQFTVPVTGYYKVYFGILLTNTAGNTQQMTVVLQQNGTTTGSGAGAYPSIQATPDACGGSIMQYASADLHLNVGDVMALKAGPTNVRLFQGSSWFGAMLIAAG